MRKIIYIFAIFLTLVSCNQKKPKAVETEKQPKGGYILRGEIENFNDQYIYCRMHHTREDITIDSVIVKNNQFVFKGVMESPSYVSITVKDGSVRQKRIFTIIGNEDVLIKVNRFKDFEIIGSDCHDLYERYQLTMRMADDKYKGANSEAAYEYLLTQLYHFAKRYHNHVAFDQVFESVIYRYRSRKGGAEEIQKMLDLTREKSKDSRWFKITTMILKQTKSRQIGVKFMDYSHNDPEGNPISLLKNLGTYTYVDLWASWCGGCRIDIPKVKEVYAKFKNKGLKVYCISFDDKVDKWKKAIAQDKSGAFMHVSELKGWKNNLASRYGIKAIPDNFILDKDGIIVANNLRGEALDAFLTEAYK